MTYSLFATLVIYYKLGDKYMKVLLFTHKNDIDGMGNAILARLAFRDVKYELCGTFELTEKVLGYYNDGSIYDYDKVFVTDLCLEDPVLSRIAQDERLKDKILNFDHHKTFACEKYTKHSFVNVLVSDEKGLCCGTSLFYNHLVSNGLIDKDNLAIKEFVELTRQHDTWEWKNIYNNEKARYLATLFDVVGCNGYIDLMTDKLKSNICDSFEFNEFEKLLIDNRLIQIEEKMKVYANKVIYKDILGLRAGINFITYEYRNELAQYFKDNNFDIDFAMMIALDPGVVCYRSVKNDVRVRDVAEYFGGKGHDKAASNPITDETEKKLVKILTSKD